MSQIDLHALQRLPLGLMLLDPEGHVSWANSAMGEILGCEPEDLIGSQPADLPDQARQLLAGNARLIHLPGVERWIEHSAQRLDDGKQLLVASDVSERQKLVAENARLSQQVEDLQLHDELTGLPNRRSISQALDLHISRSRRYSNPLSIVLAHVDRNGLDNVQELSADSMLLAVSRFLRDRLRWVDQIARWDENTFLLVLPETSEADARGLIAKIDSEQETIEVPDAAATTRPALTFGLACWKKGNDMRTLLRDAVRDLRGADSG